MIEPLSCSLAVYSRSLFRERRLSHGCVYVCHDMIQNSKHFLHMTATFRIEATGEDQPNERRQKERLVGRSVGRSIDRSIERAYEQTIDGRNAQRDERKQPERQIHPHLFFLPPPEKGYTGILTVALSPSYSPSPLSSIKRGGDNTTKHIRIHIHTLTETTHPHSRDTLISVPAHLLPY